jgi:hypothetical protein
VRKSFLQDMRIELESQIALRSLKDYASFDYYVPGDVRSMYLLLDGGGYLSGCLAQQLPTACVLGFVSPVGLPVFGFGCDRLPQAVR